MLVEAPAGTPSRAPRVSKKHLTAETLRAQRRPHHPFVRWPGSRRAFARAVGWRCGDGVVLQAAGL